MSDRDTPAQLRDARTSHDGRVLEISRRIVDLYIDNATSDFTIKELARQANVAERTFYRYFARKEDVVRPFLSAGLHRVAAAVAARPASESIKAALVAVWGQSWVATQPERSRTLFEVMNADDGLRAVWFQVIADSEAAWAESLASRLGIDPKSQRALLAGAVVVAASRLSGQVFTMADITMAPVDVFAANLDLLGPTLFTPKTSATASARQRGLSARPLDPHVPEQLPVNK